MNSEILSTSHVEPMNADFTVRVAANVAVRIDEMATQYHNPYISVAEREKLYRIWLLR